MMNICFPHSVGFCPAAALKPARILGFLLCLAVFACHPSVSRALTLVLPKTAYQGDMILGLTEPNSEVRLQDSILPVGPQGHFVLAVPRNRKTDLKVTARRGKDAVSRLIRVWAYSWRTQSIKGLLKRYVTPNAEALARIRSDAQTVRSIRRRPPSTAPLFIQKGFVQPVAGRVSGIFGSQRILNGVPRSPHTGVDIAAPAGTPVHCPADGIVTLTAGNMFLMGNTLMVDHGLGVSSIFIHLQRFHVKVGDRVFQGDVIADVGKTGRATGPHLHWGVSVGETAIDPLRLLKQRFRSTGGP